MNKQHSVMSHVGNWWDHLTEGWHELSRKADRAITRFTPNRKPKAGHGSTAVANIGWSLMPIEIREKRQEVIVELEIPGMDKNDFVIEVHDRVMQVSGEKYASDDRREDNFHIVERAYGRFERSVMLPCEVEETKAQASYKNGVLSVHLPKRAIAEQNGQRIPIQ